MVRDMTEAQFIAALGEAGFTPSTSGLWFLDASDARGCKGVYFGGLLDSGHGLKRRATLWHLVKLRAEIVAEAKAREAHNV